MKRTKTFGIILGEESDKALESGAPSTGVITQAQGVVPLIPVGDQEGGAVANPGWRIHGDAPYVFVPGVDAENGIAGGQPSATPQTSKFFQKIRIAALVHPDEQGTRFCEFYCSDGSDAETGRGCATYQELWGSQSQSAGDITGPYGQVLGIIGDFDFTDPATNPSTHNYSTFEVLYQWEAAAGATSYDIFWGYSPSSLVLGDTTALLLVPAENFIPTQAGGTQFVPGTYYIMVRATDAAGNFNYTPIYQVSYSPSA